MFQHEVTYVLREVELQLLDSIKQELKELREQLDSLSTKAPKAPKAPKDSEEEGKVKGTLG